MTNRVESTTNVMRSISGGCGDGGGYGKGGAGPGLNPEAAANAAWLSWLVDGCAANSELEARPAVLIGIAATDPSVAVVVA